MITREKAFIGLAAGIGGIAPNMVNLAQGFTGDAPYLPGFIYYVGVVIFFFVGAAVALIFSETDHRKAFFLGVSLPALIAAIQTQVPLKVRATDLKPQSGFFQVISNAHAQPVKPEPPSDPTAVRGEKPQTLTLKPVEGCAKCELWFFNAMGRPIEKKYLANFKTEMTFEVPSGATQVGIWNDKINPNIWKLPDSASAKMKYEFTYKYHLMNDLKRGLGDFNIRPYDLEVKPIKPSAEIQGR